ncbi:aromatic alcohol reductase, partial [Salmonella sp. 741265129_HBA]
VAFARGDGMWWPMSDTWNVQHHLPTQDIAAWLKTQQ